MVRASKDSGRLLEFIGILESLSVVSAVLGLFTLVFCMVFGIRFSGDIWNISVGVSCVLVTVSSILKIFIR